MYSKDAAHYFLWIDNGTSWVFLGMDSPRTNNASVVGWTKSTKLLLWKPKGDTDRRTGRQRHRVRTARVAAGMPPASGGITGVLYSTPDD
jgi:hypothetical protein